MMGAMTKEEPKQKAIDLNVWNAATIYVYNRLVADRVCVGCGSCVLKSDSEEDEYQCLKCDTPLLEHEIVEIPDCNISASEFAGQVALAYDYMVAEKERQK